MPTAQAICEWEQDTPKIEKWVSYEEPYDLKAEIEQAQEMLELADNWDGEGSRAYSKDTLDRAVDFLTLHSDRLLKGYNVHLPPPKIGLGPDGSIDLHWKERPFWELLVNIPAEPNEMAAFYGDNYGTQKIKGSIDPKIFSLELFTWLMR